MSLAKKRIVVIGGTSGIGLSTAKMAVQRGAEVVIASHDPGKLERAKAEIGGATDAYPLDVRDEAQVAAFFRELGEFDHLTVPGSAMAGGPFLSTDTAQARADFDSKFWGQYCAVKYGAPGIRPGGSVVLFSGMYAHRPPPGTASVAAANGAVESLARALAVELAPLRVNVICPGVVDTPLFAAMPPDQREAMFRQTAQSTPAGRVGQPDELAQAVLFLMEDSFATGTILVVDGGATLR